MGKRPDIYLIITDALRYDVAKDLEFAKKAPLFLENVYSNAPSTHFSLPSIMTGELPFSLSDYAKIPSDLNFLYLPVILKKLGYSTIGITANTVTSHYFGYSAGFDVFEDFATSIKSNLKDPSFAYSTQSMWRKVKEGVKIILRKFPFVIELKVRRFYFFYHSWFLKHFIDSNFSSTNKVRASAVVEEFKKISAKVNKNTPIFAFFHFMETHTPYAPLSLSKEEMKLAQELTIKNNVFNDETNHTGENKLNKFLKYFTQEEVTTLQNFYVREADFLDKQILLLLNYISQTRGLENALVIIMSDHGECFGEDGYLGHPSFLLNDTLLHVPVSMYGGYVDKLGLKKYFFFTSRHLYRSILASIAGNIGNNVDMSKKIDYSISYKGAGRDFNRYVIVGCRKYSQNTSNSLKKENCNKEEIEKILQDRRKNLLKMKLAKKLHSTT